MKSTIWPRKVGAPCGGIYVGQGAGRLREAVAGLEVVTYPGDIAFIVPTPASLIDTPAHTA